MNNKKVIRIEFM